MKKMLKLAALTTSVALFANFAVADVVKLGVLAPLTGATASDGEEFVRGVEWAVDETNAAGGINGDTFEIVVADVKDHSPANVSSAVERLLGTDGVHAILTGYASLSLFEVEMMAEANMPYIAAGPSPSFAAITQDDPDAFTCCWSYTASYKGYETDIVPMIEELENAGALKLRGKTVAIISSDNPYSSTISEGMKETFNETGWDIVVDETVPSGEVSDWKVLLAKVTETNPAVVVNTDYLPGNSALFLKQFREAPTDSLVFLQYAPSVPEFLTLTGDASTGVLYNLINAPLDSVDWPRGQEVMQGYRDRYGIDSGTYGVSLYEMTKIYFDAVRKVGDPRDHDAIGVAIGETDKDTVAGRIKFDPATHVALQSDNYVPVSFWQIWEGERTLISPKRYSNGSFQQPPWMTK